MAESITGSTEVIRDCNNTTKGYVVALACQSATDGSFTATVLNTLTGVKEYPLKGMYLYMVSAIPGDTAPTDATDLTITDANGLDLLGGAGTDLIDATSITSCVPRTTVGSISVSQQVQSNLTINITNNSVNTALFTLRITFTV